jgi:hypothetical protein
MLAAKGQLKLLAIQQKRSLGCAQRFRHPYLSGPVCEVTLLGAGQSIAFEQRTDGLHLTLPSAAPAGLADDIAYVFVMPRVCPAAISTR